MVMTLQSFHAPESNILSDSNGLPFGKSWNPPTWGTNFVNNKLQGKFVNNIKPKMESAPIKLTTDIESSSVFKLEKGFAVDYKPKSRGLFAINPDEKPLEDLITIKADSNGSSSGTCVPENKVDISSIVTDENSLENLIETQIDNEEVSEAIVEGECGAASNQTFSMTPFNISLARYTMLFAGSSSVKDSNEFEARSPTVNRSPFTFKLEGKEPMDEKVEKLEEVKLSKEKFVNEEKAKEAGEEKIDEIDDLGLRPCKTIINESKPKSKENSNPMAKVKYYSRIFWAKRRIIYDKRSAKVKAKIKVVENSKEDKEMSRNDNEKNGEVNDVDDVSNEVMSDDTIAETLTKEENELKDEADERVYGNENKEIAEEAKQVRYNEINEINQIISDKTFGVKTKVMDDETIKEMIEEMNEEISKEMNDDINDNKEEVQEDITSTTNDSKIKNLFKKLLDSKATCKVRNNKKSKINYMTMKLLYKKTIQAFHKRNLNKKQSNKISSSSTDEVLLQEKIATVVNSITSTATAVSTKAAAVTAVSSGSIGCTSPPLPLVVV